MNQKINNNIKKARFAWQGIKSRKTYSQISIETGLHTSEISNIKKYTFAEMYVFDQDEAKRYLDELFEKRELVKKYEYDIKNYKTKLININNQLSEFKKTWFQKLYEKWRNNG